MITNQKETFAIVYKATHTGLEDLEIHLSENNLIQIVYVMNKKNRIYLWDNDGKIPGQRYISYDKKFGTSNYGIILRLPTENITQLKQFLKGHSDIEVIFSAQSFSKIYLREGIF